MTAQLTNPTLFMERCLIGDEWVASSTKQSLDVVNPFNGERLGSVPVLSADDVNRAIQHAANAQKAWAKLTVHDRAKVLHAWADLIDDNLDDLAKLMTLEQGKPIKESRGEIAYANSYIRWFAEQAKRHDGDIIPTTHNNQRLMVLKQAVGVCACITPWNFPSAMITRKVAPALASGCSMIVKPASETPFSALALGVLAKQAGIPSGVLQIITGNARQIGEILTHDPRIAKLSFTGSTKIGRVLMSQSAPTLKKLSLELGGNAPFIVFADADIDKAVNGLIASKYRNAGQTCVCANRVFVQSSIKDKFIALLCQKVQTLKVGNGLDKSTDIAPLINQSALDKVQSLLTDALDKGAVLHTGGTTNPISPLSFNPTVISDITDDMAIAHEEIFGPIAPIFTFDNETEVIERANATEYGLAAYFYTNDLARSWRVSESLEYGMVAQNTGILSNAVAPFGGVKQSGFGREGSKYGLDEYTTLKYWCVEV